MDGDGWRRCERGHVHWGRYGAAGLLVVAPGPQVLLQHRAPWSHGGDTWGVPGGARRRGESAVEAALRETVEETALDATPVRVGGGDDDGHGGWAYGAGRAGGAGPLPVERERESVAVVWGRVSDVAGRRLHDGFAASWPLLLPRLAG